MIETRLLRELHVAGAGEGAGGTTLAAASGLVEHGGQLFVIADDEFHLAQFARTGQAPGRLHRLFDGVLPAAHTARKSAKPDGEALALLPALAGHPHGALLALGSGSRATRQRGALLALDAQGEVAGPAQAVDLAGLYAPLAAACAARGAELNLEGAFVQGERLRLLQRGNGRGALNACIELPWPALRAWLSGGGPPPEPAAVQPYALGELGGVPLSFTDGAALPGGAWLFSAAAEASPDSYADGPCAGSALGLVDAAGTLQWLRPLAPRCKVEGLAAAVSGAGIGLLMVTDADDRSQPSRLLAATLPR